MPRGGPRAGAGKPKGYKHKKTVERLAARERYLQRITAEWDPIIDAQLDAGKGYSVMFARQFETDKKTGRRARTGRWVRITDDGEIETLLNNGEAGEDYHRIFLKDPDVRMLSEFNAQVMGKPKESVEISGPNGGPIEVHDHFAVPGR
jgi:hypothetical protein